MNEPIWIEHLDVEVMHEQQIAEHGGSHGVRDEGLLLAALARPRNLFQHGENVDLAALAASYGFGIAKNHAYIDGNKRVAFVVMATFLLVNGRRIRASEPQVVTVMLAVADGTMGEEALAAWLREHVTPG
ncbi:MAG TPA: type II toxin-antitoxin system death-on-curing family toxin [Gemmatimonadaceae bacterium]|nr:type II toxin-antitoxin system death-on-curing family toxin [Gemmatimonadaceae bacterium]